MKEKPTIEEIMNTPNWTMRERIRIVKRYGKPPIMSKRAELMRIYYPTELNEMIKVARNV